MSNIKPLTRIIITCPSIQEAKNLASERKLEYFKHNLVYSYLNNNEGEPQKIVLPGSPIKVMPEELICPKTGLIGKIDSLY